MGTATAAIGVLPGYATLGAAAPLLLILLCVVRGLALGGEYAGAATCVGEHAPDGRRGYCTSFIQLTPTIGLFASSVVVLSMRAALGEPAFNAWGWRMPFLISLVFVAISYYIRVRLEESPVVTAGQAVLATTTQLYVLFFLQRVLKVVPDESYTSISLPYNLGNGWFGGFLRSSRRRWWRRQAAHSRGSRIRSRWR